MKNKVVEGLILTFLVGFACLAFVNVGIVIGVSGIVKSPIFWRGLGGIVIFSGIFFAILAKYRKRITFQLRDSS